MKKISLLIIALLAGFCVLGQNTVTLESGTSTVTPQFRYKAITPDSLNHLWIYNPLTAKYNRIFTATESNLRYAPATGGGYVPSTRQILNGYGILGGTQLNVDITKSIDTSVITSITRWNTLIPSVISTNFIKNTTTPQAASFNIDNSGTASNFNAITYNTIDYGQGRLVINGRNIQPFNGASVNIVGDLLVQNSGYPAFRVNNNNSRVEAGYPVSFLDGLGSSVTILPPTITANRNQTLQDDNGVIALTKNITALKDSTFNINKNGFDILSKSTFRNNLAVPGLTTANVYTNNNIVVGSAFGAYASSPTGNPSSYLTNLGLKVGNTDDLSTNYYGVTRSGFVKDIGGSVYTAAMQSSSGTLAYLADIPSVSGYVPYTGATANLVTTFNVSAKTLISTGTAGNGYLDLLSQSVSPSSTSGHLKIYSDSLNRLSWKNSTYRRTIQVPYSSDVTIRMPYKATPTLADSTDIAAGYIQNQTALTQTGGFKINGNGTLANITASGTSTFGVGYNGTNANKVTITENNTSSAIGVVGIQNKSNVGYSSFDMYDDSGVFKFGIGYANSGAGGTLASNSYLYSATGSFIFTGSGGEIFRYTSTGLSTAYQYAVSKTALATTSADGILLANTTAATSGVPIQYSPDFRLRGTSWNTTATAASNTQDAKIELRPTSGTTTGSLFALAFSNNGGAYIDGFTVASSGNVYTPGNINTGSRIGLNMISGASALLHFGTAFSFSTSGSFAALNGTGIRQDALTYTSTSASGTITAASVNSFAISSLAAGTAGTTISDAYTWYIAGAPTASTNVSSITRSWAFGVNSGSSYFGGAVVANSTITLKGYTVATLPAGTVGMTAYVTDALAPTYLVAVAGGGSVKTPVFFDGTNWVAH